MVLPVESEPQAEQLLPLILAQVSQLTLLMLVKYKLAAHFVQMVFPLVSEPHSPQLLPLMLAQVSQAVLVLLVK